MADGAGNSNKLSYEYNQRKVSARNRLVTSGDMLSVLLVRTLLETSSTHGAAQVPASRCKAFAESAYHEVSKHLGPQSQLALKRAANCSNINNAERDLHKLFRDQGLCLPISATTTQHGKEQVDRLSLHTWFPYLLSHHSKFLLGGFQRKDWTADLLLRTFWKNFEAQAPDHEVFELHGGGERMSKCIPFYLHLDEGTSLRKSAVLVVSWQPIFGRETYERYVKNYHVRDLEDRMAQAQFHNNRGNTYLSRFLLTVMPKKMYGGSNSATYWGVLDTIAKECCDLMTNGITVGGWRCHLLSNLPGNQRGPTCFDQVWELQTFLHVPGPQQRHLLGVHGRVE